MSGLSASKGPRGGEASTARIDREGEASELYRVFGRCICRGEKV